MPVVNSIPWIYALPVILITILNKYLVFACDSYVILIVTSMQIVQYWNELKKIIWQKLKVRKWLSRAQKLIEDLSKLRINQLLVSKKKTVLIYVFILKSFQSRLCTLSADRQKNHLSMHKAYARHCHGRSNFDKSIGFTAFTTALKNTSVIGFQ